MRKEGVVTSGTIMLLSFWAHFLRETWQETTYSEETHTESELMKLRIKTSKPKTISYKEVRL